MAGTKAGGLKASETNKRKHGADFYKHIGRLGGIIGTTGGFASDKVGKDGLTGRDRASIYGTIGGRKSKRGPARRINDNKRIVASTTQKIKTFTTTNCINYGIQQSNNFES